MKNNKKISIIIVNWNHADYLSACLDSIHEQTFNDYEVVIIDNNSQDDSLNKLKCLCENLKIKKLEDNFGFSKAFNLGLTLCEGDYILSLNPDVVLNKYFLEKIYAKISSNPLNGIVSPKLLRADNQQKIDSTGLFLNFLRNPFDRGQGEIDKGQYDKKELVFGACGAASLFSKKMIEELKINNEFLDEDFFAYYDDADISWRANIYGWRCIYTPDAVATHVRGWGDTLSKFKKNGKNNYGLRMALRNKYLMIIKNDHINELLWVIPILIIYDALKFLLLLFVNPKALFGYIDLIRLFPNAVKKRKIIQANRQTTDFRLRTYFNKKEFLL